MTKDDAAQWTCDKTKGKGAERQDQPYSRITARKEGAGENQRCSGGIEKKVVPLDAGSSERC